jgi:hypothetical protein
MSDDVAYIKLAENIFEPVEAPWTYRILTPLIVFLLPFDTITGFIIVNLSSLYATSILLFYYLRKLGFNFQESLLGVLFFLLNPVILVLLISICVVDLLTFFFLLLAFYALLGKKDLLFLISVTIGVANREVILITLVLLFILKIDQLGLISAIKLTIIYSIPPMIIFCIIRFIYGFDSNYFSINTVYNIISIHFRTIENNIFIHPYLVYISFGIFWVISLLNITKIDNYFLGKSLYLIPFVFLQVIIATNYSRLLFIAFPIIIPISLYIFKVNFSKRRLKLFIVLTLFLLIIHFIGILIFIELNPYSKLMIPENYIYYALYLVLFDIYSVIILIYLLLKGPISKKQ